jgi:hypothetical protein
LIPTGERSGLQTRIGAMESIRSLNLDHREASLIFTSKSP